MTNRLSFLLVTESVSCPGATTPLRRFLLLIRVLTGSRMSGTCFFFRRPTCRNQISPVMAIGQHVSARVVFAMAQGLRRRRTKRAIRRPW